jgi:hypothetical protein
MFWKPILSVFAPFFGKLLPNITVGDSAGGSSDVELGALSTSDSD